MTTPNSTTERGVTGEPDYALLNKLIAIGARAATANALSNSDDGARGTEAQEKFFATRGEMWALLEAFAQSRQPSAQGGERVDEPTRCANCGKPYVDGDAFITEGDPEGEAFCSTICFDQHGDLGCPHEHHSGYRHPAEAKRLIDCENALRSLASWLGVGGYNAPEVDAKLFEQKIRDGVSYLVPALATPPATSGMKEAEALRDLLDLVVLPNRKRIGAEHGSPADLAITNAKKLAEGATPACYRPQAATHPNASKDSQAGDAERLDWLSTEAGTIRRDAMGGLVPSYINWGHGVTLRQSIDAAIRAGKKG